MQKAVTLRLLLLPVAMAAVELRSTELTVVTEGAIDRGDGR